MSENERAVMAPTNGQVIDFGMQAVVSVDQALNRIKELQSFIAKVMVKGEDYGVIPGMGAKPTLFKPGAEKLCEMYGLYPSFDITDAIRDWEAPFFHYEIRCRLVGKNTGVVLGEGLGSCNSREKNFRNRDAYTLANTIFKMAKKRALVDAALSATRSSGIFTQDIEDIADDVRKPEPSQPQRRVTPAQPPTVTHEAEPKNDNGVPAKNGNRQAMENRYRELSDRADAVNEPAEMLDPKWSDEVLKQKGMELAPRVHAAEEKEFAKASGG